jgi:hypothetical protein
MQQFLRIRLKLVFMYLATLVDWSLALSFLQTIRAQIESSLMRGCDGRLSTNRNRRIRDPHRRSALCQLKCMMGARTPAVQGPMLAADIVVCITTV